MAKRKGVMLAKKMNEKYLLRYGKPYLVQSKIAGIRCRAVVKDGMVTLLSSSENVHVSVPHINKAVEELYKERIIPANFEIDGELYNHEMPFSDIQSIVMRTINLHPNFFLINYYIFDIVNQLSQVMRANVIGEWKGIEERINHLYIVPTYEAYDIEEIMLCLSEFMNLGYEGIIIRNPNALYVRKKSGDIMKYKPRLRQAFPIIDVAEEISIHGKPKNTLGAFICVRKNQTFRVGTGPVLTKEMRKFLWEKRDVIRSCKLMAEIKYETLTSPPREVPYCPVVVDIKETK